jgi:hypothetical protein
VAPRGRGTRHSLAGKWLRRVALLKFMRTLWLCEAAGGPFTFAPTKPGRTHLGLEEAHRELRAPNQFARVEGDPRLHRMKGDGHVSELRLHARS